MCIAQTCCQVSSSGCQVIAKWSPCGRHVVVAKWLTSGNQSRAPYTQSIKWKYVRSTVHIAYPESCRFRYSKEIQSTPEMVRSFVWIWRASR